MNKNLGSKNIYKIFLALVKFLPITLLLIKILGIICCALGITTVTFSFLGGTSIIFLILLYIIAEIFKYCYLYKMPLYYLTFTDLFILVTKIIAFDIVDAYRIIFITSGIFMVAYITYTYLTRNNPNKKVDYIKDLCERYCNC